MMATGGVWFGRLDSLGTRIAALLTLALLPLGLIAIVQTYRVLDEASQRLDMALIGQTLRATRTEAEAIRTGIVFSEAVAATLPRLVEDTSSCRTYLASVVERSDVVKFAGFWRDAAGMACASAGSETDRSKSELLAGGGDDDSVFVRALQTGPISGGATILVTRPVFGGNARLGSVVVSLAHHNVAPPDAGDVSDRPVDILTFNGAGQILTASDLEGVQNLVPANVALGALVGSEADIFREVAANGDEQIYTVTPIVPGTVYAMAIWPVSLTAGPGGLVGWTLPTIVLPVLMWIASLSVAFFAVHHLVIRHVKRLRQRMWLFSRYRRVETEAGNEAVPAELRDVVDTFETMAHTILREEADLENSLREKDLLLREVFHRVRNNLQLIASMNNMQIRASEAAETKRALRRLQDRIMALSTIHAALYEAPALSKIRADDLVVSLARQVANKAANGTDPDVRADACEIRLYPDLAVPLALLTVETVTNAAKHFGRPKDGSDPWIEVCLSEDDGLVRLDVRNSVGRVPAEHRQPEPGGLGQQLINAFAMQLAGEIDVDESDEVYRFSIEFRPGDYGEEHSII